MTLLGPMHSSRTALSRDRMRGGLLLILTAVLVGTPVPSAGQTISGTLLDLETDQPIQFGLVMLYTTEGDSITQAVSDARGRFSVTSPEPGSFVMIAAALGYEETRAGTFDLGPDGRMQVEYRLPSEPLPLDAVLVSVGRPVVDHHLVRNGFVRRLQRGTGRFITPYDIEQSTARSTEALFESIPSMQVGTARSQVGGLNLPMPHLGETVQFMTPAGLCTPTVYVDGRPARIDPRMGVTLSHHVSINDVEAVEVYRRAAEIPVEFAPGTQDLSDTELTGCGMILVWTKRGPAAGQRPLLGRNDLGAGAGFELPDVDEDGPPPIRGEAIRLELRPETARRQGIDSPWHATFETMDGGRLVAIDERTGRPVAVPVGSISDLQVSRRKGPLHALWRAGLGGALIGIGSWGFLEVLCSFACGDAAGPQTVGPAIVVGLIGGGLIGLQGPGRRWVRTTPSELEGAGVSTGRGGPGGLDEDVGLPGLELTPGPVPGSVGVGWRLSVR